MINSNYFSVELAVIRQDFHYIRYRAIYSTPNRVDASHYFTWMQQYLKCHCLVRLVNQSGKVHGQTLEMNCPKEEYEIPPERKWHDTLDDSRGEEDYPQLDEAAA